MKRIGYLLGRRIRGDIELGRDSFTGRGGAITAPGARLNGRPEQDILEQSLTPNYVLGTRRIEDDRVFRYARAGNYTALWPTYAVISGCGFPEEGLVIAANSLAGTYTVTCESIGVIALNQFEEGYLVVAGGTERNQPLYRIRSNTAQLTPGGEFTITLWRSLMRPLTAGDETITLYRNKFAECRCLRAEYRTPPIVIPDEAYYASFIGLPLLGSWGAITYPGVVAKLAYFWAQTWGPCSICTFDWFGGQPSERWVGFYWDGSVICYKHIGSVSPSYQHAGFLLPLTYFGGASHETNLMELQISP